MTSILPLIGRRILVSVVILLIVSALLFCILRLLPVDPAAMSLPPNATLAEIEAKRREMGLDQPLFRAIPDLALGRCCTATSARSIHFRRGVAGLVGATLPATIELAVLAMLIAGTLGIAGGLFLFHVRGTRAEPSPIRRRSCCCRSPNSSGGCSSSCCSASRWQLLPFTGRLSPGLPAPGRDRLPADRHAAGRATRHVLGRAQAHDPAGRSRSASRSRRRSCACCARA